MLQANGLAHLQRYASGVRLAPESFTIMKFLPIAVAFALSIRGLQAAFTLDVDQPDIAAFRSVEKTDSASGHGSEIFWDQPADAILVGLALWEGRYGDAAVIGGMQPIYEADGKRFRGRRYGRTRGPGRVFEAKPGEAVFGITVRCNRVVDGMEIAFAPRGADGQLDGISGWRTPWIGRTGSGPELRLGGDGRVTVGLFGRSGTNFDGIGLLRMRKVSAPAMRDAPQNFAEIARLRDIEWTELLDERAWRQGLVAAKYFDAIEKLRHELSGPNHGADLAFLDAEIERVQMHTADSPLPDELSAQVQKLRRLYDAKCDEARRLCDAHSAELAGRIIRAARNLAVSQGVPIGDIPPTLAQISPPDAMDRPASMSDLFGGPDGGYFFDLAPQGYVLAGFRVRSGTGRGGRFVVRAIEPIWRAPGDRALGPKRGQGSDREEFLEAAEGYAVGGIRLRASVCILGMQVIFMKLGPDGSVDSKDSYESPWAGSSRPDITRVLDGSGRPAIGFFGRAGAEIDSLGLVFPK